ncbi:MAG: hypothetical protein AAF682_04415 [Planctomycetota bacterium]
MSIRITLALSLLAAPAAAGGGDPTLFAIGHLKFKDGLGAANSSLYTLDAATGAATLVGEIGNFWSVSGLAVLRDGRLVGSAHEQVSITFGTPRRSFLIEIDRATGAGTYIGEIGNASEGGCGRVPDLAYDPLGDVLYGYGDYCANCTTCDTLLRIDPDTGEATPIGATGFMGGGNGLGWDVNSATLYGTPSDGGSLVTLDTVSGAATSVPGTVGVVPGSLNGLAFHPDTGELYGSLQRNGVKSLDDFQLVVIDTATGVTTTVGTTVKGIDALAFDPGFGPVAACAFRAGSGANPAGYDCVTAPALGEPWESSVATAPTVGTVTLSTIVATGLGGPTGGVFAAGWELLILPPYAAVDVAAGSHSLPVPALSSLLGVGIATQGARLEAGPAGILPVLLNAQDLMLGF